MNKWLLVAFIGFVGGVAFRSFFYFGGVIFPVFLVGIAFVLGALLFFLRRGTVGKYLLISVFIGAAGAGMLRMDIAAGGDSAHALDGFVKERIELSGIVVDDPDARENHTNVTVEVKNISRDGARRAAETRLIAMVEQYPRLAYGDEVHLTGELQKPKNFSSSGSAREFDYISYLGKDGIFYRMQYPRVEILAHDKGNPLRAALFSLKRTLMDAVSRSLPEPHASLVGGIVFGAKQGLGKELLDAFRATGIIHIVVLSGYNITIVADAIGRMSSLLPRALALSLSSIGIIGFALMTGAGATVVRASVMALLVLLARATGRLYVITRALFIAAFLMLLFNPWILVFDPSFQLSFLATVGLLYLAPHIEERLRFIPAAWQMRSVAAATIATQFFVLPLLLYMTGQLSIVALPVNLLILVFMPLTMFFGFLTGALGIVNHLLALPAAAAAYGLLAYELAVVSFWNAVPFAAVSVPYFPAWLMAGVYAAYGLVAYVVSRRGRGTRASGETMEK